MFIQLGDKIFEGLYSPTAWSSSGNDALYVEHALINGKPRLQLTGEALEQVTLTLRLRAEFCNPTAELQLLEEWQSAGTILPLLLGNGEYVGDYVITSLPRTHLDFLPDGTLLDCDLSVSLLEYVAYSKIEEENLKARRNAFAVGDKEQSQPLPPQRKTPESEAHQAIHDAIVQMNAVQSIGDEIAVSSNPQRLYDKMRGRVDKARDVLTNARNKVQEVQNAIQGGANIINATNQALGVIGEIGSIMQPPVSLQNLKEAITNLRTANSLIGYSSLTFTQNILLRRF